MKKVFIFLAVVTALAFCTRKNNKAEIMTASNGMQYVKLIPITGDANTENGSNGAYQGYEIKAVSTDNTSSVEILPYSPYYYADGPTTRSLRETSRSMGMEQKLQPFEMPPMNPLVYIKQIVLPRLQQNGTSFQISNEQDLGEQNQFKGQPASRHAYVDGRLSDGRNIRVECGIQLSANNMNGEIYYNWSAFPAIITGNNLDENYDILKHIRGTVLYNPEWEQQCNAMNRKGNAANAEIAQKNSDLKKQETAIDSAMCWVVKPSLKTPTTASGCA